MDAVARIVKQFWWAADHVESAYTENEFMGLRHIFELQQQQLHFLWRQICQEEIQREKRRGRAEERKVICNNLQTMRQIKIAIWYYKNKHRNFNRLNLADTIAW